MYFSFGYNGVPDSLRIVNSIEIFSCEHFLSPLLKYLFWLSIDFSGLLLIVGWVGGQVCVCGCVCVCVSNFSGLLQQHYSEGVCACQDCTLRVKLFGVT